ncbi:MAG: hypothetical protein MJ108_03645 [Saccharofermentans sp.]|nr:hypothetical protein [Saccharofermentans sp.]
MAKSDAIIAKINKLASKGKLDGINKYSGEPDDEVRKAVAVAFGQIPGYETGMALIPLLRDSSASVRAAAAESAGKIRAKNCEEYIKKLAFADSDPNVRIVAKEAFDVLKDRVV